ncbi:MAG: cupin domain-containing protein [Parvularculaceae bacterium]|nr:cupin domain-containing protein [Parvularculaceae bacterium]
MVERKIAPGASAERDAYYRRISQYALAPLWERLNVLLTKEPQVRSTPFHWDYDLCRNVLFESADLISAHEAERRVLILDNPGLDGASAITENLYAGWQLLMPGEVAPAHRHSASALRFILEGDGAAYTAVDGEKAYMRPGDMVLTPSMRWHDHGHEGTEPVVWLDVLDLPFNRNLGPIFLDLYPDDRFPDGSAPGTTRARFGRGLKPVALPSSTDPNSPMFYYPYEEMRAALVASASESDIDPVVGHKLEYMNPNTGGPALATISTFLQWMPAGFSSQPYRTTEGMVFSIVEGEGSLTVEHQGQETTYEFKPRDTLVVPCWGRQRWDVRSEAIVFCASDRNIQEQLGLFREQLEGSNH